MNTDLSIPITDEAIAREAASEICEFSLVKFRASNMGESNGSDDDIAAIILRALTRARQGHSPDCDTNDANPEGIRKPCNCASTPSPSQDTEGGQKAVVNKMEEALLKLAAELALAEQKYRDGFECVPFCELAGNVKEFIAAIRRLPPEENKK